MNPTLSTILTFIGGIILAVPGIYAAVVAGRLVRSQSRQQNGSAADAYAGAAQKMAELNRKYTDEIVQLKDRLELLENPQRYRVTVEFATGAPPEVGAVKVEPIEALS